MTDPTAAPVVLLHPIALDAGITRWLDVPRLEAITLPGTGAPGTEPVGALEDLADVVASLLSGPVHLTGCSLGGMVAMHVALRHPALVLSLMAAFTTARAPHDAMIARADRTAARGAVAMAYETLDRWFTPEALAISPRPEPIAYAEARLISADTPALAATWRAIADHDVLDELGSLRMPTTLVAGTRDLSVPVGAMRDAARVVPGATYVETPDAHMGVLERPQQFSMRVREHVRFASVILAQ